MVSRKSRTRKTADNMASYKQDMEREPLPVKEKRKPSQRESPMSNSSRASPRGNSSKARGTVRTRSSPRRSADSQGGNCRKDPCDEDMKEDRVRVTRLESVFEVPETPPRETQVAGRKRALAPQALQFGEDVTSHDTDSQVPSKKRKAFHTPPRAQTCGAKALETIQKDALAHTPVPVSSAGKGHGSEMFLDMDLSDDGSPTVAGTFKESDQIRHDWAFKDVNKRTYSRDLGQDNDLNILSVSMQALTRTLESFKRKVVEEMCSLYRTQKSDLREYNASVMNPLISEVRDIRSVLEMMSNGGKNSSSGKLASKTSLTEWEFKLNQLTPKVDVVFTKEVFARILCFNAPLKVCEVFQACERSSAGKASIAAQSLLWGHQPGCKKDEFSEGLGKLHSDFKYKVVQNTFYNVCKQDTFDLFRSSLSQEDSGDTSLAGALRPQCRINRPGWLAAGYVTLDHINEARSFLESANQSRKNKVRDTASPDDIASHGALRVYRLLGAHLHKGRDYMRTRFFQDLGYLFVPWKEYVTNNDQRKMKLWFASHERYSILNLEEIPCTDLCSFGAGVEKCNQVHADNRDLLKRTCSEWPGMVLHAEYDVHVTQGGGTQRRLSGGERRTLHRLINLIEVACDVVVEYSRVGSIDLFLRGHKYSLRCIMVFAFLIRKLTQEFINMRGSMDPDPDDAEKTVPHSLDVVVHETSLKVFLPGKTVQENYLTSRCLRFSEIVYSRCHSEDEPVERSRSTRSGGEVFDVTEIMESEELGVAAI